MHYMFNVFAYIDFRYRFYKFVENRTFKYLGHALNSFIWNQVDKQVLLLFRFGFLPQDFAHFQPLLKLFRFFKHKT